MVIFLDLALDLANASDGVQWKLVRPFWLVKPQRCLSTNVTVSHKLISRPMNIRLQLSQQHHLYAKLCSKTGLCKWKQRSRYRFRSCKKGSPCSITECRAQELIPVLGSQPTGDVSHQPSGRLPLLSAKPAVTLATLKRAATNFAAWWTEAQWVWTVCLRLLPDSIAAAIWIQALLRLSLSKLTTRLPSQPLVLVQVL